LDIKINKEIRSYQESIFFGLSMRQMFCSVGALGIAVGLYFLLNERIGKEPTSWLCIIGAAPFAAAGFFRYNGMTVEKFAFAWLKSEVFCAGRRLYKAENYFYKTLTERRYNKHGKNLAKQSSQRTDAVLYSPKRPAVHSHSRCFRGRRPASRQEFF
jgi:hypothetical protein